MTGKVFRAVRLIRCQAEGVYTLYPSMPFIPLWKTFIGFQLLCLTPSEPMIHETSLLS